MKKFGLIVLVIFCVVAILVNMGFLVFHDHFADYVNVAVSPLSRLSTLLGGFVPHEKADSYSFYYVRIENEGGSDPWIVLKNVPTRFEKFEEGGDLGDAEVLYSSRTAFVGYFVCRKNRFLLKDQTVLVDPVTYNYHVISLDSLVTFDSLENLELFLNELND